jgi:hypothetical protein
MPSAAANCTASPMLTSRWPVSIAEMVLGSILCPGCGHLVGHVLLGQAGLQPEHAQPPGKDHV